jgi:hypothetical protein
VSERDLHVECQRDSWGPNGRYDLSAYGYAITVLLIEMTSTSAAITTTASRRDKWLPSEQ